MISATTTRSWRQIFRTLWPLTGGERGKLSIVAVLGILLALLEGVGLTLILLLVYRLLGSDDGVHGELLAPLERWIAGIDNLRLGVTAAILMIASSLTHLVTSVIAERAANAITHSARMRVYRGYLVAPYALASSRGHGAMLDTLDYEVPYLTSAVMNLVQVAIGLATLLVYGMYLMLLAPPLIVAAALIALLLAGLLLLTARWLTRLGAAMSERNEGLLALTIATVQGLRTIRLHAAEARFIESYRQTSDAVASTHVRLAVAHGSIGAVRQLGKLAALPLLIGVAVSFALPVTVTLTTLVLLFRIAPTFSEIEGHVLSMLQFRAPLGIVAAAVEMDGPDAVPRGGLPIDGIRQRIAFDDVDYAFDADTPVLQGVSFIIPAGTLCTVMGPSGGGKTTLINLIARLFEPQGGTIRIDGVPLDRIDRDAWLGQIGFAGQDIELSEGTIRSNLTFDDPHITDDDLALALRVAQIGDFVHAQPLGLETRVGERGLKLSGGQRQRIVLARAIARRPSLLILDEATNAVDMDQEAQIFAAIRAALPDATVLVITHRTTVVGADHRFVLRGGRVEELADPAPPPRVAAIKR